mmetsp:Transcript_12326/g.30206  ORF Transcript_12326/g.30206 Transcript_12326/m.30206 type:complete len:229 (-) Transcript_12326:73-759(-)|eukprot:CAMPEP_0206244594 /NCGR_PEP_ID=MMETSP0047_2-20121206/18245_1 /ASSEMBLY_ACC=CAM_ASM_000192 /TAXON_ID=195065 /ORGANISM="Chroomonas mesostigmatica_cf, Strain CCMP1168" /LENGTH=228 /DNA_ID=CAMNT_0053669833 /DNA_START=32 /DNA_END=718 /DNA_ORIENTATION=-
MKSFCIIVGLALASSLASVSCFSTGAPLMAPRTHLRTCKAPGVLMQEQKQETFVNKLVGPKLFKTVTDVKGVHQVPLVALRVAAGTLMLHHGTEGGVLPANFGTEAFNGFDQFITQKYFAFLPGPSILWSAVHDYIEFWGALALIVGFATRPAALSLLTTMLGAVYFHLASSGLQGAPFGHVKNYSYDFEEPALYALIFLVFFFNGAGPLSVDSIIYDKLSKEQEPEA